MALIASLIEPPVLLAADIAAAPPEVTTAPAATPAATALARSPEPICVEPDAKLDAMESDLYATKAIRIYPKIAARRGVQMSVMPPPATLVASTVTRLSLTIFIAPTIVPRITILYITAIPYLNGAIP